MIFATADLHDKHGDQLQVADSVFQNYGGNTSFHGKACTLKVFEDFLLIKQTLQQAGEGRVLIIDGGASMRCAMLGDRLTEFGVSNNWAGIIINGCIRDSAAISKLAIGVKALNTCPIRPSQNGGGETGLDLHFAGVVFSSGAYVYADSDGIVISPTAC